VSIWGACVSHRHGCDHWLAGTEDELYVALYGYVVSWWRDWFGVDGDEHYVEIPDDPKQAVKHYFQVTSEAPDDAEYLDVFNDTVVLPWEGT